ncbi:MAG TPA: type II toxin-antitoxin system VapC family toxin [Terracidiphilus sp.]|jgi:predicted nucleic acid-binding protein|nr:type II toxin-antitoxin system VapC family toxin [Terracidiphilus sp.]
MERAFWDSSSLIPLCVRQTSTPAVEALSEKLLKVVWWGACVEIQGSFARLERMGLLPSSMRVQAQVRLDHLRRTWREIEPTYNLRDRAEVHVERFGLTGADAFQLAAAWTWCSGSPHNRPFVSGDRQLIEAAELLGFKIVKT